MEINEEDIEHAFTGMIKFRRTIGTVMLINRFKMKMKKSLLKKGTK